jgi:hypothetical protein
VTTEETKEKVFLFDMEFFQPQCPASAVRGLPFCAGRIKGFSLPG